MALAHPDRFVKERFARSLRLLLYDVIKAVSNKSAQIYLYKLHIFWVTFVTMPSEIVWKSLNQ